RSDAVFMRSHSRSDIGLSRIEYGFFVLVELQCATHVLCAGCRVCIGERVRRCIGFNVWNLGSDRGREMSGAEGLKEFSVALGKALRQFVRFSLGFRPVDDLRTERRLSVLRIPPFAPGLPVPAEILSGQPHQRNLSPP